MEIPLPSGATVVLRERLTHGQRKQYFRAVEAAPEMNVEMPVLERDGEGEPVKDEHGNPVAVKDEQGRVVTEHRTVIAWSATLDNLDVLIGMLVESWTLDLPLPSAQPNVLDQLDIEDADALATAARPLLGKFFPQFAVTPEKGSPSGPSSA